MGHKVNPVGLRLGINRTWDSRWFARKDYAHLLHEDLRLKGFLISMILMTTSDLVRSATLRRIFSISAPFLPITTPGRAE